MFTSAHLIPLIIEIVAGAASGALIGNMVPLLSLGFPRNAAIGAIGGVALTWLLARTPGLEKFVEDETAAAAGALGGMSPETLAGVGVAGLLGGVLLVAVVGLLRIRSRG
jgi:hypothetical protein